MATHIYNPEHPKDQNKRLVLKFTALFGLAQVWVLSVVTFKKPTHVLELALKDPLF